MDRILKSARLEGQTASKEELALINRQALRPLYSHSGWRRAIRKQTGIGSASPGTPWRALRSGL